MLWFVHVRLEEIQKEVQCPICLGIIRKSRTVMECMHRFCCECINKAMRLGNNECPACRSHCASHRSIRDDLNFDALISMLFPDIDIYEKEQLSFNEEETARKKMIQDSISETFRWQPALLGKKSTIKSPTVAYVRRARKRGRGTIQDAGPSGSDNEDRQNIEVNAVRKEIPLSEERPPPPEERPRRRKKSRQSTVTVNMWGILNSSTLIAWGCNKVRSRHAKPNSGSKHAKVSRSHLTKLVQHLRNAEQVNSVLKFNVILVPIAGSSSPKMEKPYISCDPPASISHFAIWSLYRPLA